MDFRRHNTPISPVTTGFAGGGVSKSRHGAVLQVRTVGLGTLIQEEPELTLFPEEAQRLHVGRNKCPLLCGCGLEQKHKSSRHQQERQTVEEDGECAH